MIRDRCSIRWETDTDSASLLQYLNKPAWEPLIPPPLPEPHGRPYTLVIDLDDMLVHSSWDVRRLVQSSLIIPVLLLGLSPQLCDGGERVKRIAF